MNYPDIYHFPEEQQIPSPQLVYYEDQIRRNTEAAIRAAGGAEHLWPHVKSHKMRQMIEMQLTYGIRRFKCATVTEARMVAEAGASAVMLAYAPIGPQQSAFLQLRDQYPSVEFYTIADDLETLRLLGHLADTPASVLVDVDTGLHRTGVAWEALQAFYEEASTIPGIQLCGFHLYDGEDHQSDPEERRQAVARLEQNFRPVYASVQARFDEPLIIFGGTPSMPCFVPYLAQYPQAFLSPGTLFLGDHGYSSAFPDMDYPPAAAVLARVISHPGPDRFTLDCGTKALSCDQKISGFLLDLPADILFQNEEHMVCRMREGFEDQKPAIGSVQYLIPTHICTTTILYPRVPVIRGGHLSDIWEVTARDRLPLSGLSIS